MYSSPTCSPQRLELIRRVLLPLQAAEKAHQLLKSSRDQALADLRAGKSLQLAPAHTKLDVDSLALSAARRSTTADSASVPTHLPRFSNAQC